MQQEENNLNEMLLLRRQKLQDLRDQGKDPFVHEKYNVTHKSNDIKDDYDSLEGSEVSLAGRIMSKRGQGKVSFSDIQDSEGRSQLFIKQDNVSQESYELFKTYDIGDIIGVVGEVFKTRIL